MVHGGPGGQFGLQAVEGRRGAPGFAAPAGRLGAGAVFAFPLSIGAIRAGVMGLYRASPGPLPHACFGDALILADAATMLLLDVASDIVARRLRLHDAPGRDSER